jgi:hypothetical protein
MLQACEREPTANNKNGNLMDTEKLQNITNNNFGEERPPANNIFVSSI